MGMMDNPFYSICKLDKQRFFWAAWASYDALCERQAIDSGYAATREEAAERASAAVGPSGNDYGHAGFAQGYHRHLAAQRRAGRYQANPTKETGSAPVEYIYCQSWDNEACETRYAPHRIIKKTARKVFIDRDDARRDWHAKWIADHPEDLHTIALDREELDRTGQTHGPRRQWYNHYYTKEAMDREIAERVRGDIPRCFTILDLEANCTRRAIQTAYRRKARDLHPDNGGDHEAFIALQSAYEEALRLRPA